MVGGSSPDEIVIGSDPPADRPAGRRRPADGPGRQAGGRRTSTRPAASRRSTAPSWCSSRVTSKGEAETGQSEAQRLIDEGAVALVGTYQSDVTQNVASVAERSRVPLVIDVAVDDQILEQGYQYTFRIQPNATDMGTDGAERLLEIAEQGGEQVDSVSYIHDGGRVRHRASSTRSRSRPRARASPWPRRSPTRRPTSPTPPRRSARPRRPTPTSSSAPATTPTACSWPRRSQALSPDIQALYGVANGAFDDENFPNDAGAAGEGVLSRQLPLQRGQRAHPGHPQALRAGVRRADGDRGRPVLPGRRGHRAGAGGGRLAPTRAT